MMNINDDALFYCDNVSPLNDSISDNQIRWQKCSQNPFVIWFTGLSGSGKTTTAQALEYQLNKMGFKTFLLDGDIVRKGLCSDLSFSEEDRHENLRRMAHVAKVLFDAGLIVLVCAISPFEQDRQFARNLFDNGQFLEIYMNTSLSVCEARDPKGLYKQARGGKIADFTGIDSIYEAPVSPDFVINTEYQTTSEILPLLLSDICLRCKSKSSSID